MYNNAQVVSKVIEADTVYIEKLRVSLSDMAAAKEAAIRAENYMLADAMRQKMLILDAQLASMEYQFNADIIINTITSWQIGLATAISKKLDDVKGFVQDCTTGAFPLKDPCHQNFLTFIQVVPPNYYDALVRSLLLVMPHDVAGVQKSPYGWDAFSRRIPQMSKLHPESVDFMKSVLILSILDLIVEFSGRFGPDCIKKETLSLFVKHAFTYLKASATKKLSMEHEAKIFEKITQRWAIIIGDLAVVGPTEILRNVFAVLDIAAKRPSEEIVLTLASVRYIFGPPSFETASDIIRLVKELVSHFERNKKTVVRLCILQTIEKLVQPLDFTRREALESWESGLNREMMELYKTVARWGSTSEDLRAAATRVCVVIVVNSSFEFFQPTISSLLLDLLNRPKAKPYVYHCILQLLRGRWFADTKQNAYNRLRGLYSAVEAYGFLCRPVDQESRQSVADRIKFIADSLFVRRKERISVDNLEIVVEILIQMAAHSLDVTLKLVSFFLNNRTAENCDNCYVGVRAIRAIIDPESGFLNHASCGTLDPNFADIVNSIPYEFDTSLVALIQFCDSLSGISVLGISGLLVEPGSANVPIGDIEEVRPNSKNGKQPPAWGGGMSSKVEQMYARGDADLVAMLNESMDTMSIRNSISYSMADSLSSPISREDAKKIQPGLSLDTIKEKNVEVRSALVAWYDKVGSPKTNVDKFAFASTLEPSNAHPAPAVPIDRTGKERPDLIIVLMLFREILRTIPFIPQPDLVIGKLFIGPYLLHSHLELARETSQTLERTFIKYPEFRIDIIRAILDLIKNTSLSDISYATIMLHMTYLIGHWSNDFNQHIATMDPDKIQRLSCKLDACLLIMLARPNPRIRHASLTALADFYKMSEAVSPHLNEPGFLPLQAILNQRSDFLSRNAIFSFMERDLLGHKLSPNVYALIPLLAFNTVASSDFSLLFKFYLGELARQFGLSGRPKALRHCAKFLTALAVPYMTSVTTVDNEFVITYSNYMVLLMALGGVPLVSEDGYSLESYSSAEHLLFNNFRHFLAPILNSDNQWEIRAIVQASYYMHISLYQLYIVHLWQWYAETRQNSLEHLNPRMLDNIIYAIRSLCQNRDFEIIAREPSVFQSSIIEIIVDFIRMTQTSLQDCDFLRDGPVLRVKLAINFCAVVSRLAYSIFTAQRFILDEQEVFIDGVSRPSMFLDISFPGLGWDTPPRLAVLHLLKNLTTAAEDAYGFNALPKVTLYRTRLLDKVGLATENLLVLGDIFEGEALPADVLLWLCKLQRSGYNVFPPAILYNYENALGTVLAHSYNKAGRESGFLSSVINQVLPRPMSSLAFASNYLEEESIDFAIEVTMSRSTLIYPEADKTTSSKINQNIGSLVFFGIYNLLNAEKRVRCRSFRFLRELFSRFGDSSETLAEMDKFAPMIPTKAGEHLRKIAVRFSQVAASFFGMDAPSFFWEAVRCSRTVQKSEEELLLVPSQKLILDIIVPWAHHVSFADMNEDLVSAEFFRYLMDATFYKPKHFEEVRTCWKIISSSADFGRGNSEILAEILIHIRGKLESFSENVYNLLCEVFQAHHITVAECCAHYLDARSFRPIQDSKKAGSLREKTKKIVVEYVGVLYIALTGVQYDASLENVFLANASAALITDLFIQDFVVLRRYLAVTLTYALLHLPDRLDESNVVVGLILSLIDGCWGVRSLQEGNETLCQLLLDLKQYLKARFDLDWRRSEDRVTNDSVSKFKISITDLVSLLFGIFVTEVPTLVSNVAFEIVCWAHEGHVTSLVTRKALDIYNCLIGLYPEALNDSLQSFSARVLDQVGTIQRLDIEPSRVNAAGLKESQDAKALLFSLLNLHGNLMNLEEFDLDERCLLFWESACILKMPYASTPDIWTLAMQNCLKFLKSYQGGQLHHHFEPIRNVVGGVQPILLQGLFSNVAKIQEMSFDLLLLAWSVLPTDVVDSGPTGLLYTCLYSILWIFSTLEDFEKGIENEAVKGLCSRLQSVLTEKSALEFAGLIKSLQGVLDLTKEDVGSGAVENLLEKCSANLSQIYFPDYITNTAEFCCYFAQAENASYSRTSLRMVQVFWSLAQRSPKSSGAFKSLLRKLAFYEERREIVMEVFSFILSETADSDEPIKEVDLTSYGKTDMLESFPSPSGSAEVVTRALRSLR
ncbi:hypothetical protein BC830DRAFT_1223695 [Chytriomyces sp. MP71]|nr:hypothetical protein BC830DRAFT_1223695 [Chytriomyces sp. MP71]